MGRGFLTVELFVGNRVYPIKNAKVLIKDTHGKSLGECITDDYGLTEKVSLEAPDRTDRYGKGPQFSTYDVEVPMREGFKGILIHGVQIFDGIASLLPVQMYPISSYNSLENTDEIYIPSTYGLDTERNLLNDSLQKIAAQRAHSRAINYVERIHTPYTPYTCTAVDVSIPKYITVHLGSPYSAASHMRIPFKDYIKNIASSEIYPTWEESALYANIYAQISLVLNRICTAWYRSRDKDFDITSDPAFDPFFVKGRNIFENISQIVDRIFNVFLRKQGESEPFFAAYCNGTTSQCAGLSQWGSQNLALRGYTPIEILRHYYTCDMQIVESLNFESSIRKFGGASLQEGSIGQDVRTMQLALNKISINYHIPSVPVPDGVFDYFTKNSTREFQRSHHLVPDGIIGFSTWYAITMTYLAMKEHRKLAGECQKIAARTATHDTVHSETSGNDIAKLQFLLNYISEFYPSIPCVMQNGAFRDDTQKSVMEFQKEFRLTPDGFAGPVTWRKLYELYHAITNVMDIAPSDMLEPTEPFEPFEPLAPFEPPTPKYPGSLLKYGSQGSNVLLIQNHLVFIAKAYPRIPIIALDGIFGPATQSAVKAMQKEFGLPADGLVGPITWNKIISLYNCLKITGSPMSSAAPLGMGCQGHDVLLLQKYLCAVSEIFPVIPTLAADGIFGPETNASVVAFQSLFGLPADGVIGKKTWERIIYVYHCLPDTTLQPYPGRLLLTGKRGYDVTVMQTYLIDLAKHYPALPVLKADGIFGSKTRAAVIAFQKTFSLIPDGIIGQNTWNKIMRVHHSVSAGKSARIPLRYPGSLLKIGRRGQEVVVMQTYLTALAKKYPSLPLLSADGIFGPKTQAAVRAFQKMSGLAADGIIGKNTWNKVVSVYNMLKINNASIEAFLLHDLYEEL